MSDIRGVDLAVRNLAASMPFAPPDRIGQSVSCDVARRPDEIDHRRRPGTFSHVVFRTADYPELGRLSCDLLGFKVSDRTDGIDFLRCARDHHSVALGRPAAPDQLSARRRAIQGKPY